MKIYRNETKMLTERRYYGQDHVQNKKCNF